MNTLALLTARAGSKSVKNKNVMPIEGNPLYSYNLRGAIEAQLIDDVVVTTDIEDILNNSLNLDYFPIPRPDELCGDGASHYDTIWHAVEVSEAKFEKKYDIVVVLLGNSYGAFPQHLDAAVKLLNETDEADSVISVSEFNMFNPFRAYTLNKNETLTTVVPQEFIRDGLKHKNSNDKTSAGNVFFFNGSFWVIKRDTLKANEGLLPFPWLGNNILPYHQNVYMEIDAPWQTSYVVEKIKNG